MRESASESVADKIQIVEMANWLEFGAKDFDTRLN